MDDMSQDAETGPELHNVESRAQRIRDGFAEIYDQEREIAAEEERTMQPLKKARTKMWRNLKKDVDIPRKTLELEYKQYKLARQAVDDELDGTLDDMREVFEALHPGQSVDWVSVVMGGERQDAAE